MSHFGNSPRTQETERRMALWRQAHPDAPTSEYNRAYEATWNSLTEFSDREAYDLRTIEEDEFAVTTDPYQMTCNDETLVVTVANKERLRGREEKRLYGSSRPPRHRKQATKGAFGKRR